MIRQAEIRDIDALADMGMRFLAYSAYSDIANPSREDLIKSICQVFDTGVIFVSDVEGEITGALSGILTELWFAPGVRVAAELAWWIDEQHRGSIAAVGLLRAFENWAQENGAKAISLSDLKVDDAYPAAPLFQRLGYEVAERAHVRRI